VKIIAISGNISFANCEVNEIFYANFVLRTGFVKKIIEQVAKIQLDSVQQVAKIPNAAAI
jgi:hypothetical protein